MALVLRGGLIMTPTRDDVRVGRGTIVVDGDRIARVEWDGGRPIEAVPGARIIDAGDRIVIPGLVDAHAHFYGSLIPGLVDRLPLDMRMPYLGACLEGWEARDHELATLLGAARMLRNGTTTVLENVLQAIGATEPLIRALVQSGMRAVVGPMITDRAYHDVMPEFVTRLPESLRRDVVGTTGTVVPPKEMVDVCRALAARWHGAEGRISFCLSPAMPHRCSDGLLTLIAEAAAIDRLVVHTHLLETRAQAALARRLWGHTMVEHLHALGLLREGFSGAHAVWLTDRDIDLMAESGAAISHNPLSNLYLGSGIARVPRLLERGVAVGIGSDGPNCGSTTSLVEIMKLAAIVHRLGEADSRRWPSAADAFRMATLGGARAVGLAHEVGSIEVGKKADLVLLDRAAPSLVPLNDPVMQLVYGETGSAVRTVIVNGEIVVEDGHSTRLDVRALLAEAAERGDRLAARIRPALADVARLEPYLRQAYLDLLAAFDAGERSSGG
jgi:cytosine/adenosine deaminase-related metal-dependent hydrolase